MAKKKISLREFQESLVQRLTSARAGQTSRALLGVRAGRDYWLLDLSDSGEIVPLPPLTTVPLTKPWFCGIANIRGTLYSVVDFSAFQGGEATPQNADSRLLIVGGRFGINSALLVNRTLGLRNLDEMELRPAEAESRPWVGEQHADQQGNVWKRLKLRDLLGQPDFLEIGLS
ncbi:MAG TPA: chemotaxis protein CheW [Candidatus Desulfobacillus denitrificans]|nr:chemotaxis protein CheW [Candidatus Desulfobacillus denitrificans]HNT63544.1 chemotaxis protein CheW [Candidatus Desulfobacillus denitrificans]